jgi:hypothetical protein
MLLWGGKDFRKMAKDAEVITTGDAVDTLAQALTKIRTQCGGHVNLTMAMYKLMHIKQGTKSFTQFKREVEELAVQCQFETNPYTKSRAIKDAIIYGTSDEKLQKEALAKDVDLAALTKAGLGYEQARKSHGAMKSSESCNVRRVEQKSHSKDTYTKEEVDEIVARVTAGKYSSRYKDKRCQDSKPTKKCPNCPKHYTPHAEYKCPAKGKTCVVCKKQNHFAGSKNCKGESTIKKVEAEQEYEYDTDESVERVQVIEVRTVKTRGKNNMVRIQVNGHWEELFVDSGCSKTLIPLSRYNPAMGEITETETRFKPYGTKTRLNVIGSVSVKLIH